VDDYDVVYYEVDDNDVDDEDTAMAVAMEM
jgi:hypothetical protein